ncbi:LytR/AlgR family response regulator transcription factor [Spirosoma validum]|uniref:Response regulator transcription factor n=1 Tax=Spirosoma validum TaxID=2771355 RepID=A0A927B4L0_9BACT|nr:response regulator transcription factor [Spirosoma validum]MBD2755263.1 response regulator transcription factor [Spirosoma validum]
MALPLSCLVIDDEPLACQLLERFIGRVDSLCWLSSCSNAVDALSLIRQHRPNLLFLDIEMPEVNGLELLSSLPTNRPQVILTTAFPDYALDGFEYDVTDYLLKPIRFDRFLRAIHKVHGRSELISSGSGAGNLDQTALVENLPPPDSTLWLKVNKQQIRLPLSEIVFLESMKDYTHFTLEGQSLRVHQPLSAIEALLGEEFLRINRSFIVRCSAITAIKANAVELITKHQLPIGITYRELVRDRLRQYISAP